MRANGWCRPFERADEGLRGCVHAAHPRRLATAPEHRPTDWSPEAMFGGAFWLVSPCSPAAGCARTGRRVAAPLLLAKAEEELDSCWARMGRIEAAQKAIVCRGCAVD